MLNRLAFRLGCTSSGHFGSGTTTSAAVIKTRSAVDNSYGSSTKIPTNNECFRTRTNTSTRHCRCSKVKKGCSVFSGASRAISAAIPTKTTATTSSATGRRLATLQSSTPARIKHYCLQGSETRYESTRGTNRTRSIPTATHGPANNAVPAWPLRLRSPYKSGLECGKGSAGLTGHLATTTEASTV